MSSKFLIPFFLILFSYLAKGQGCSDAGVCTINSFKPNNTDTIAEAKNQFKIGVYYGKADNLILVWGNYLEYNRKMSRKIGLNLKMTTLSQNGNGISSFGLSDIYLNANYKLGKRAQLTLGTKIPLMDGNKKKDNIPLPMDYQSSLGTFDLILGIGYEIKNIQLVAAIQQPFIQNKNEFLVTDSFSIDSKLRTFQSTNKYERRGDVLLRVSYPIKFGKKFKITPSVLPIYHLGNDRYTDALGMEKDIAGSQGLTLNGNVYFDIDLNKKNALQLNMGMPFLTREKRPDGLTRKFVVNLEYKLKF